MIDPPYLTTADGHPAAVIPLRLARVALGDGLGAAIGEIQGMLAAQSIEPAGAPFAHYLAIGPDVVEVEVGVPVAEPFTPGGRVAVGALPALKVARTQHHGPYEGLTEAWTELKQWMDDTAHAPATDAWEFYLVGPGSGEDPAHWRTELNWPLHDQPKGRPRDLVDR